MNLSPTGAPPINSELMLAFLSGEQPAPNQGTSERTGPDPNRGTSERKQGDS